MTNAPRPPARPGSAEPAPTTTSPGPRRPGSPGPAQEPAPAPTPAPPNVGSHLERAEAETRVRFTIPDAPFEAREGDVLQVSYPEVTLPLAQQYTSVKIGGLTYTRRLREGDDVRAQFDSIYGWLRDTAEGIGADKVKLIAREFRSRK